VTTPSGAGESVGSRQESIPQARRTGESVDPLEESIPQARPRATAYVLGVLLIAIIGIATATLFLIPSKNLVIKPGNHQPSFVVTHASIWLGAIGLTFGLIGLISLIYGNTRRLRLIYEFTASAAELTVVLIRMRAERRDLDDDEDLRKRRHQYMNRLNDYKDALLKLGAYEHAMQVSRWIAQSGGRLPYGLRDRV
jgi:hypothetical protein